MISILISIFNEDPTLLVQDLSSQLERSGFPYEILIGNDCSESKYVPVLSKLEEMAGVSCFHSPENIGRSRIRNTIAGMANHPFLLFIDGDARVNNESFIDVYLENADPGIVLCGGTAYFSEPPGNKEKLLRWKYGVSREAKTAKQRESKPHSSFSSFNFLIPAEIFLKVRFNEGIKRYGHEDTLFGIELERGGIPVLHLDNQLIHEGLDSSTVFLRKTREGILNLKEIQKTYEHPQILVSHIRLLSYYSSIRKWGGRHILSLICRSTGKSILKNLKGPNPSLRLLDLYKLCILNDNKG